MAAEPREPIDPPNSRLVPGGGKSALNPLTAGEDSSALRRRLVSTFRAPEGPAKATQGAGRPRCRDKCFSYQQKQHAK